RVGLLGNQGPWQVQLAACPVRVSTEATHILNDLVDLLGGQFLIKSGHDLREPAIRSSMHDDRFPGRIGLRRSLAALREVGKSSGRFEPGGRLRRSASIRPMAGDATRLVDVLAGIELRSGAPGLAIDKRR